MPRYFAPKTLTCLSLENLGFLSRTFALSQTINRGSRYGTGIVRMHTDAIDRIQKPQRAQRTQRKMAKLCAFWYEKK